MAITTFPSVLFFFWHVMAQVNKTTYISSVWIPFHWCDAYDITSFISWERVCCYSVVMSPLIWSFIEWVTAPRGLWLKHTHVGTNTNNYSSALPAVSVSQPAERLCGPELPNHIQCWTKCCNHTLQVHGTVNLTLLSVLNEVYLWICCKGMFLYLSFCPSDLCLRPTELCP